MKYGMRERLSGAVILIALAVIFVPMLFDEPAPRQDRPEPSLSIDAPIDVERHDVSEPEPPATLGESAASGEVPQPSPRLLPGDEASGVDTSGVDTSGVDTSGVETSDQGVSSTPMDSAEATGEPAESSPEAPAATEPAVDPIAELARAADQRLAESASSSSSTQAESVEPAVAEGEWAVQVGSFGEPANVERLLAQLRDEGFTAYSRPRGNNLTTVYVGPFGSSEAGERAVAEVKSRINLQGLLVRVKE